MSSNSLIDQLTLSAGLNTETKILEYLELSRSTWYRRKNTKLRKCEIDALRSKSGFINHKHFLDFRIRGEFIYSPSGQFATANEIDNMWLYRQILSAWNIENKETDERYVKQLKLI